MSALTICPPSLREHNTSELPQQAMRLLHDLERERIRQYAEMLTKPQHQRPTRLENQVDNLLDSFHSLRRLEELAVRAADGNPITESSDIALINANGETYRRMLERQMVLTGSTTAISDGLLPGFPQPVE